MNLYTYFRSSAAYRVRIALNLKGVAYTPAFVNLAEGEQAGQAYRARNPQGLIPALEDDGQVFGQSMALIEYLDERYPKPALLPGDAVARQRVRAMAQLVACDIHPLNNLRVLRYLKGPLGQDEGAVRAWYHHWVAEGFAALEALAETYGDGQTCYAGMVTQADICLAPQMWNARRFECDLDAFPTLRAIDAHLQTLPAFADAAPEAQPDNPAYRG